MTGYICLDDCRTCWVASFDTLIYRITIHLSSAVVALAAVSWIGSALGSIVSGLEFSPTM